MTEPIDHQNAKQILRDEISQKRSALSINFRKEAALSAAETFAAAVPIKEGQIVSLYWAIREELNTEPLLLHLVHEGHQVCLPVVKGREVPLEFRIWQEDATLYPSGFGTLAPGEDAPVVEPDVMVLPMLGFDAAGNRLGYGAGHYDRTIAHIEKPILRVGYAYSMQEVAQLPAEAHDKPLDMVVTEAGVRRLGDEGANG